MNKTGFFEEKPNTKSANRLIFVFGMFWLMAIVTLAIFLKTFKGLEVSWTEMTVLYGSISGILVGLKLGQKAMENSDDDPPPTVIPPNP